MATTSAKSKPVEAPPEPRRCFNVLGWILGLAGVLIALTLWIALSRLLAGGGGVINRLPGPAAVAQKLLLYATTDLWLDLVASLRVFLLGWLAGVVFATVIGIMLGRVRLLGAMFLPLVEAIRPVSSIAWVPLSIVWFGFGLMSKVFLVGLAVYLVVIVYAVDGSNRIPADLSRTAAMLGMNPWQRFLYLILPGTLSEVLVGMRVSLMTGWGTVIVAELVAADSGLGAHLISSQQSYDIPTVMATMVCFGAAGFVMNAAFGLVEVYLVPWRRKQLEAAG